MFFFLFLVKTLEKIWILDVFRGYRKKPVTWKEIMWSLVSKVTTHETVLQPSALIINSHQKIAIPRRECRGRELLWNLRKTPTRRWNLLLTDMWSEVGKSAVLSKSNVSLYVFLWNRCPEIDDYRARLPLRKIYQNTGFLWPVKGQNLW